MSMFMFYLRNEIRKEKKEIRNDLFKAVIYSLNFIQLKVKLQWLDTQ